MAEENPIPQPPDGTLEFDELLALEEASLVHHEYRGGHLHAMTQGTALHAHIITNLTAAVHKRLRGKPCRATSIEQRVRTGESATNWYYPDLLIKCPPYQFHPRDPNALLNPHAIFEVLSPATELFDRTDKFDEYALIAELTDYVLISADRIRIEHFHRANEDEWIQRIYRLPSHELRLKSFAITIPLSEIYEVAPSDAAEDPSLTRES